MDFTNLQDQIKLDDDPVVIRFEDNSADFAGSPVEELFDNFFDLHEGKKQLIILPDQVEHLTEQEEIHVHGTLKNRFLGLDAQDQITITFDGVFFLFGDEPNVVITLSPGASPSLTLNVMLGVDRFSDWAGSINAELAKVNVQAIELGSAVQTIRLLVAPGKSLTLNAIPQYLAGVSTDGFFPDSGFPSFENGLTLHSFGAGTHLDSRTLTSLSLAARLSTGRETWKPFGDFFEFKELTAQFIVANPLNNPSLLVDVAATAFIGGTGVSAQVSLPSRSFSVMLAEGEQVSIKGLLESIFSIPIPIDTDFACTAFGIIGEPEENTFQLFATIEQTEKWPISLFKEVTIDEISVDLTYISAPEVLIGGGIAGQITLGSTSFVISARKDPGNSGWLFTGGNAPGSVLDLAKIGEDFGISTFPEVLKGLTIPNIDVSFNTLTRDFSFFTRVEYAFEDSKSAQLDLSVNFIRQATGFFREFAGILTIGSMQFGALVQTDATSTFLKASFIDRKGFPIDLFGGLLNHFTVIDAPSDITFAVVSIRKMIFSVRKETGAGSVKTTTYNFVGDFGWTTDIELFGTTNSLQIDAGIDLTKEVKSNNTGAGITGTIEALIQVTLADFDFLPLGIKYNFGTKAASFYVPIGEGRVIASYTPAEGTGTTTYEFKTSDNLVLGDVVNFFVGLADPSIDEFEFDEPWKTLSEISLSGIELKFSKNKSTGKTSFTFTYRPSSAFSIPGLEAFISINALSLSYANKKTEISLEATFLGKKYSGDELKWDPVNDAPPEVPGKGRSLFELRYFGLGQRVTFDEDTLATFTNVTAVMTALRGTIDGAQTKYLQDPSLKNKDPLEAADLLVFNRDSDWLIGASFVLLKTLDLRMIFNDPVIYGIRIELSGDMAKKLAGLQFEILYRRISDTVGVYHLELVVPDIFRQMQFGAVSITLPIIVLDIYTNGDFKIDFGFPWKSDFSRSFAVEVFPFTGAAGFYFNKLSAVTASSTPVISNGVFDPVYEFGLGLKIGLGKSFNKGPLKAELSITLQAILEGVISWFNPDTPALEKEMYYKIKGSASLVGRIYGAVDFAVIKVEVEVIAKATIIFAIEVYQPIYISLIAEVSVKASVTILFIKVHFSFGLKVQVDFTIGSASPTPWKLGPKPAAGSSRSLAAARSMAFNAPPNGPRPRVSSRSFSAMRSMEVSRSFSEATTSRSISGIFNEVLEVHFESQPTMLSWDPNFAIFKEDPQGDTRHTLNLFFQPGFSRNGSKVQGIAMLYLENSIKVDAQSAADHTPAEDEDIDTKDFDVLMHALLLWALYAYYKKPGPTSDSDPTMDLQKPMDKKKLQKDLETLYTFFLEDNEDPGDPNDPDRPARRFDFDNLTAFLKKNFALSVTLLSDTKSGTLFPMIPQLNMKVGASPEVDFDGANFLDRETIDMYDAFFQSLRVQHGSTVESDSSAGNLLKDYANGSLTPAKFIFMDYFALLVRLGVQNAIDYIVGLGEPKTDAEKTITISSVLDALSSGGQYRHIAGMASRFMLHGLRLPVSEAGNTTLPVYEKTGQQFELDRIPVKGANQTQEAHDQAVDAWLNKHFPIILTVEDDGVATPDDPAFISFEQGDTLAYDLEKSDSLFGQIDTLEDAALSPLDKGQPISISSGADILFPFYRSVPDRFGLSRTSTWDVSLAIPELPASAMTADGYVLYDLPDALQDHLAPLQEGTALKLEQLAKRPGSGEMTPVSYTQANTLLEYVCAARIEVRIRKVPVITASSTGGDGALASTFILEGTTERGKDQLEGLWGALDSTRTPVLYMLFDHDGTWGSDASAHCDIFKVNLARDARTTGSGLDESITMHGDLSAHPKEFLRLLYEAGTVESGGYYLHYDDGLGNSISSDRFGTDGSAVIHLLVLLKDTNGNAIHGQAFPFHNVLIRRNHPDIEGDIDEDATQLVLTDPGAPERQVLQVPPGNVGIRFSRDIPVETDTVAFNVNALYQLLNIQVTGNADFNESKDGLPLGPVEDKENETAWLYEKVIPAYACVKDGLGSPGNLHVAAAAGEVRSVLPAPAFNPYRGFVEGNTADSLSLKLALTWQDIYGNRLGASANYTPEINVHYTDPLIGLNQWPSVIESYSFKRDPEAAGNAVDLVITLAFDQTDFIPEPTSVFTEVLNKIRSARDTFRQVYYQVHQSDIRFTVRNSIVKNSDRILSASTHTDDLDTIRRFVDETYSYLSTLAYIQPTRHTIQAGESLQDLAAMYFTTPEAIAAQNADAERIYPAATPFTIPIDYKIEPVTPGAATVQTESLDAIVTAIYGAGLSASDRLDRVVGLIERNKNNTLILKTDTVLSIMDGTGNLYVVKDTDSFAIIADETGKTLAEIAQAVRGTVDLFFEESILEATLEYAVREGDSFSLISSHMLSLHGDVDYDNVIAVEELALFNEGVDLTPGIDLNIPGRITPVEATTPEIEGEAGIPLPNVVKTTATDTLTGIANSHKVLARTLVVANQSTAGILKPGVTMSDMLTEVPVHATAGTREATLAEQTTLSEDVWVALTEASLAIRSEQETIASFASLCTDLLKGKDEFVNVVVRPADLTPLLQGDVDVLQDNRLILIPTAAQKITISVDGSKASYPDKLIEHLRVEMDMERTKWVDPVLKATVPEIEKVTAKLSADTTPAIGNNEKSQASSLRAFASDFQDAFPGLHVALGENPQAAASQSGANQQADDAVKSLWVVHFDLFPEDGSARIIRNPNSSQVAGIYYNIQQDTENFFSIAPLANTLLSGEVEMYEFDESTGTFKKDESGAVKRAKERVENVDLNVLARDFLVAVEDFLDPAVFVPAYKSNESLSDAENPAQKVVLMKKKLAEAIQNQLKPVLQGSSVAGLTDAKKTLSTLLLTDLVKGYDIETLMQFDVQVVLPNSRAFQAANPRLNGKPVVKDITLTGTEKKESIDITLSPASIDFTAARPRLTFVFDTKTPEKFEDVELNMAYKVTDLEYTVNSNNALGLDGLPVTTSLSFIIPLTEDEASETPDPNEGDDPNSIGSKEIPVPLRSYPAPPSLILHRAEADPDSLEHLEQVREWEYVFTYEHLDVAQDTIEATVLYNQVPPSDEETAEGAPDEDAGEETTSLLFQKLVLFSRMYAKLLAGVKLLEDTTLEGDDLKKARQTLASFEALVAEVTNEWVKWNGSLSTGTAVNGQYQVDQDVTLHTKAVTIAVAGKQDFPLTHIPGFEEVTVPMPVSLASPGKLWMDSWDGVAYRWDVGSTGKEPVALNLPDAIHTASAFNEDATRLARGYEDGSVQVFAVPDDLATSIPSEIASPVVSAEVDGTPALTALAFGPAAGPMIVAAGTRDGGVLYWPDIEAIDEDRSDEALKVIVQPLQPVLEEPFAPATALALAKGGTLIIVGHRDGHVRMYDASAGAPRLVYSPETSIHTERVSDFVMLENFDQGGVLKHYLVSAGWDGTIVRWDLTDLLNASTIDEVASFEIESIDFASRIASIDVSADGRIALATFEKEVLFLTLADLESGSNDPSRVYDQKDWSTLGEPAIASVTFTPDGTRVAACFTDRTMLMLRATGTGRVADTYTKPSARSRAIHYRFSEKPEEEAALDPVFGESAIPDVTLVIPNLDVIKQQNAWAGIWLTRNKVLLGDRTTNPAFLFQTPVVRFQNMVTPYLINDEIWQLELLDIKDGQSVTLDAPPEEGRTLRAYIDIMLDSILLKDQVNRYEVRLACQYGFSLVEGRLLNRDLLPTLPVVMGMKLEKEVTEAERAELTRSILDWFRLYDPVRDKGKLVFTLNIFSKLEELASTTLPLIRIEHLGLDLEAINNLPEGEEVTTG